MATEKIKSIQERTIQTSNYSTSDGYMVITDAQIIFIGISSGQACCENYGHISSEDDFKDFIGADLLNISIVDDALNTKVLDTLKEDYVEKNECIFVNLETSKGTLQFVVYNSHNGYYGHEVTIYSNQITKSDYL